MKNELSIGFIGGGDTAAALAWGLARKVCAAQDIHVIDINQDGHGAWQARGMTPAAASGAALERCRARVFAGPTRNIDGVVASTRQWLQDAMAAAATRSREMAQEFGK